MPKHRELLPEEVERRPQAVRAPEPEPEETEEQAPQGDPRQSEELLRSGDSGSRAALLTRLQRDAGNAYVQRLVQRKPTAAERRHAKAEKLGGADALTVLGTQVPFLIPFLKPEQIEQVQRVLDARAINPDVMQRANALEQKAHKQYGSLDVVDEKIEDKAWKIAREESVPVSPADAKIRLDWKELLDPSVFKPQHINLDELRFLKALRSRLDSEGLWLLMGDGPSPQVWLSLGPEADGMQAIPTFFGLLGREALLESTTLGAMYGRMVYLSPHRKNLEADEKRAFDTIMEGQQDHLAEETRRDVAFPGVVAVSDWLGDAPDFPDPKGWEDIWRLYKRGLEYMTTEDVELARPWFVVALWRARMLARDVAAYDAATTAGAARAVKWLNRVKVASEIAGVIIAGGAGVIRLLATEGAAELTTVVITEEAAESGAAAATDEEIAQFLSEYEAQEPEVAAELRKEVITSEGKSSGTAEAIKRGHGKGLKPGEWL